MLCVMDIRIYTQTQNRQTAAQPRSGRRSNILEILTFTFLSIRVKLVPNIARALIPAQRVHAGVAAPVLYGRTFVKLFHEGRRESGFLDCAV